MQYMYNIFAFNFTIKHVINNVRLWASWPKLKCTYKHWNWSRMRESSVQQTSDLSPKCYAKKVNFPEFWRSHFMPLLPIWGKMKLLQGHTQSTTFSIIFIQEIGFVTHNTYPLHTQFISLRNSQAYNSHIDIDTYIIINYNFNNVKEFLFLSLYFYSTSHMVCDKSLQHNNIWWFQVFYKHSSFTRDYYHKAPQEQLRNWGTALV